MVTLDKIDNLSLIQNGLLHLQFELTRDKPSYFRLARESHLILYRSMIESLKGAANLEVTGRRSGNRSTKYQIGDSPWQEIHKVPIETCRKAWRFSKPQICRQPIIDDIRVHSPHPDPEDWLIGFYDALAMIQTECFMGRFVYSKVVPISDKDMKVLESLHEEIRNEYEHFIPKSYIASAQELIEASELCLNLSVKLLFESGNVMFDNTTKEKLKELFRNIQQRLNLKNKVDN